MSDLDQEVSLSSSSIEEVSTGGDEGEELAVVEGGWMESERQRRTCCDKGRSLWEGGDSDIRKSRWWQTNSMRPSCYLKKEKLGGRFEVDRLLEDVLKRSACWRMF